MPKSTRHRPRKRFGQHFLHDPAVRSRIVAAVSPEPGQVIVEIGPGHGALTDGLLEHVGHLWAVEIDRDLAAELELRHGPRLTLHPGDALKVDFGSWPGPSPFRVVGNLPYNIATPLIAHLAATKARIRDLHLMVQREVGERMLAGPGEPAYGRLSIFTGYHFRVERLFPVGRGAFSPPPQVESVVLRLEPKAQPPFPTGDERQFFELVFRAFHRRRKMIRNALGGTVPAELWEKARIDPRARPETLPPEAFARLADLLSGEPDFWARPGAGDPRPQVPGCG
jgi:16S rRNA (adenine1518-N6/adenine1519-N6)-dimethyltransferase